MTHTGKRAGGINGRESAKDHARPERKGPQSAGKGHLEGLQSLAKEEYHKKWVTYVEPIVGKEATEGAIAALLNMYTADIPVVTAHYIK